MNLIQSAWDNNEMSQMEALLQETQSYQERGFEWYYWQRMCHRDLFTLRDSWTWITSVAFSADGKQIVTGSWDNTAKVWDAVSGREHLTLRVPGVPGNPSMPVYCVAFSPDGKRVVTGSTDAIVWDAASGRQLFTLTVGGIVDAVAFSQDGNRIVTGSDDGTCRVWEAATPEQSEAWEKVEDHR